jgi:hypothetical protein
VHVRKSKSVSEDCRVKRPPTGILLFSVESWALLESLSLASLRRSAIAELVCPALEFPGVIERMMLKIPWPTQSQTIH